MAETLDETLEETPASPAPHRVVDVAAGVGRRLLALPGERADSGK